MDTSTATLDLTPWPLLLQKKTNRICSVRNNPGNCRELSSQPPLPQYDHNFNSGLFIHEVNHEDHDRSFTIARKDLRLPL